MDIEAAQLIERYGDGSIEIQEDYSGRGMYGKTTAAVVCPMQSFFDAIAGALDSAGDNKRGIIADALRSIRVDSMGLDDSVFY